MPTRCTALLAFMFALMFGARSVHADDLVVATHPYPPWIIHDADGGWSGISIDAWKQVARDAGLTYVIKNATGLETRLADDPLTCVARGTAVYIDNLDTFKETMESDDDEF